MQSLQSTDSLKYIKQIRRCAYIIIKKIIIYVVYIFYSLLYKQNKIVLYSSLEGDGFGNIDALSLKLQEWDVDFIRLSRKDRINRFIYFFKIIAKAKVLVIDASSPASQIKINSKTCLIHCWHACGAYKKIAFDAKRKYISEIKEEKRIKRIHRCISYFVCTSEYTSQIYANAFRLPYNKMLIMGSPRLDKCIQKRKKDTPKYFTIVYAPTYRTYKKMFGLCLIR